MDRHYCHPIYKGFRRYHPSEADPDDGGSDRHDVHRVPSKPFQLSEYQYRFPLGFSGRLADFR